MKKEQAQATKKQKPGDGYSYVYVGNVSISPSSYLTSPQLYRQIDPIITTKDLEAFFKPCGPVACIQVRCSRGQAVTRNMPVPSNVRTSRDRQYATVEFSDSKAFQKAIKKNGSRLKGCRLVVCVQLYRSFELLIMPAQVSVSAADLPEVKDILRR
jgi:RNA recognition motif-containing protein